MDLKLYCITRHTICKYKIFCDGLNIRERYANVVTYFIVSLLQGKYIGKMMELANRVKCQQFDFKIIDQCYWEFY